VIRPAPDTERQPLPDPRRRFGRQLKIGFGLMLMLCLAMLVHTS
jgi:hypothetical protein